MKSATRSFVVLKIISGIQGNFTQEDQMSQLTNRKSDSIIKRNSVHKMLRISCLCHGKKLRVTPTFHVI